MQNYFVLQNSNFLRLIHRTRQKIIILKNYDPVAIVLENSDILHGDPQKDLIFENAIFLLSRRCNPRKKKTGDCSPVLYRVILYCF